MGLTKEELVKKLEKISMLYDKVLSIKEKMEEFEPEDNYERKVNVPNFPGEYKSDYDKQVREVFENELDHTADEAIEYMSSCYDKAYHPQKPKEPPKPQFNDSYAAETKNKQAKYRNLSNIGLGVAIFFILGIIFSGINTPESIPAMLVIAGIGAACFVIGKSSLKKEKEAEAKLEASAKQEYSKVLADIDKEYQEVLKGYENEVETYKLRRQAFLDEYASWREIYLKNVAEENEIYQKLEEDQLAAVAKIKADEFTPALDELNGTNDLITAEYLPAIDTIINLLKSGRADDIKEAINVYEEIVYRERQLQLQREQEAQRRQDEERRHKEDMAHREAAERQRRYDEQERERREDERRAKEDKERAERERKAENDAKAEASRRCHWCKNYHSCSLRVKPPLNCSAFDPDITHHI